MSHTEDNARILRTAPRFRLGDEHEAKVRIERRAGDYRTTCEAELLDISTGGVKLRVPCCLTFEEELRLDIQIASLELRFHVAAMVRHIRPTDDEHWLVGCSLDPPLPDDALARMAVMSAVERRHWPRRPSSLDVHVKRELDADDVRAIVLNLSSGGFRILLPEPLEVGERISIVEQNAESAEPLAQGSIRWQMKTPDGIAAGCNFSDHNSYKRLRDRIEEIEADHPTPVVPPQGPSEARRQAALVCSVLAMCLPPIMTFVLHAHQAEAIDESTRQTRVAAVAADDERQIPGPSETSQEKNDPSQETASEPPTVAPHSLPPVADKPEQPPEARIEDSTKLAADIASDTATVAIHAQPAHDSVAVADAPRDLEPPPIPPVTVPVPDDRFTFGMRLWTDDTGYHEVFAQLVSVNATHVRLIKANGNTTTVPRDRLSRADNEYVSRWQAESP